MSVSMTSLVPLTRWPTSRRAVCLERVSALLEGNGLEPLRARVDAALAADTATHALEERWDTRPKTRSLYAPEARALGGKLCRTLSALDGALAACVKVWEPDSDTGRLASSARTLLFPGGVGQLTRESYVELYASVEGLLRKVEGDPQLAASLRELGTHRLLTRLGDVAAEFHTALRPKVERMSYAEVEQARADGQERLAEVLIHVASQLKLSEPGSPQATALSHALEEVLSHDEDVRRTHRRKQRTAKARARATRELDLTEPSALEADLVAPPTQPAASPPDPPATGLSADPSRHPTGSVEPTADPRFSSEPRALRPSRRTRGAARLRFLGRSKHPPDPPGSHEKPPPDG